MMDCVGGWEGSPPARAGALPGNIKMPEIQNISHRHEQIINWLICNPDRSLGDCAKHFSYTQPWLSQIIHSDAFRVAYLRRCREVGVEAVHTTAARLGRIADTALELIEEKLALRQVSERFLGETTKTTLAALGYLTPNGGPGVVNNTQNNIAVVVDGEYLKEVRERVLRRQAGTTPAKLNGNGNGNSDNFESIAEAVNS